MTLKEKAYQGTSVLALVVVEGDSLERIMELVWSNPEIFGAKLGGSVLEAAANYLEAIVKVVKAAKETK